mmetsp:Transcript_9054/g.13939  ORF Transcript_9054/g.13939 Transcript_9054/m.13939 type:complete len:403 (-) Transcript_9054:282-1490(-)
MIQADTRELEAKLRQTVLGIRQKEVSLFTDQFSVLASSATFMTSLGFGALNMEIGFLERDHGEYCSELVGCDGPMARVLIPMALFYTCAASGVAFNLLAVILASFCMIFGPELAIRGTEESMHFAVRGMYHERRQTLKFFYIGCFFIVLSGVSLGWMKFPQLTAIFITLVFCALSFFCALYAKRLIPKFQYQEHDDFAHLQSSVQGVAQGHSQRRQSQLRRMQQLSATQQLLPNDLPSQQNNLKQYGTVALGNTATIEHQKCGNVFVDKMLRYAVFADSVFRLFALDGKELSSHLATEIKVGKDKFWLPNKISSNSTSPEPPEIKSKYCVCTGTTDRDTLAWVQILSAASHDLSKLASLTDHSVTEIHGESFLSRVTGKPGSSGRRASAINASKQSSKHPPH